MISIKNRIISVSTAVALLCMTSGLPFGAAEALAAPKTNSINVIPTITNLSFDSNGGLVAAGTATAVIHGQTYTAPFNNVPVTVTLADSQPVGATCPVLDLRLGPINLNLLGLVVQTSPICVTITATQGGGLLGDLFCGLGGALQTGIPLSQVASLDNVLAGIIQVLNSVLTTAFNQATVASIQQPGMHHTCAILNLSIGPVNLTLLGLNVSADNCAGGPITVTITAVTGQGNLLGNLLCELLGGNLINIGATLQQILNQILGLLNV